MFLKQIIHLPPPKTTPPPQAPSVTEGPALDVLYALNSPQYRIQMSPLRWQEVPAPRG